MKITVPDEIRQALQGVEPVCVASSTDRGVVLLLKTEELHMGRPNIPVLYRYELATFPEGSAIRIYLEIYDRPEAPYQAETFLNPDRQEDLTLLQELCRQDHLFLCVVDHALAARYQQRVRHGHKMQAELHQLVRMAVQYNSLIPAEKRDFGVVKRRYQAACHLPG